MTVSESIPGMKPGHRWRNVAIAILYIALLPVLLALLPILAGAAAGTNFRGSADRLARLPGIDAGGGLRAGATAFVYGFLIVGLVGAVSGGSAPDEGTQAGTGMSAETQATTVSVATGGNVGAASPPTASQTTKSAETPPPSPRATATQTPSPTPTASPTPPRSERIEFLVTIVRVIDGDTMEVRYSNGDTETIRLLGVDTPEVYTVPDPAEWEGIPDTEAGRDHLDMWGDRASAFANSRLESGEVVRIVVDEQADRRGSYGRLLVYLYDDGELFNRVLIEDGYAQLYDASFSKRSEFVAAEATAKDNDVGVWDFTAPTPTATPPPTATPTPTVTPPEDGGALEVVEIHADAAGDDHENENDEYIVFENTGDEVLHLSGWRVEDEADHTYSFPDGFTLDPGAQVTLYTGSGTDTDTELYWGSDAAIWNNDGDTVYVYDEEGGTVIERSYS